MIYLSKKTMWKKQKKSDVKYEPDGTKGKITQTEGGEGRVQDGFYRILTWAGEL